MPRSDERLARARGAGVPEQLLRPGQVLSLGRDAANDLVLSDPLASRFHARIVWEPRGKRPEVHDLRSQNGLSLNGRRIRRCVLPDRGELLLGATKLVVVVEGCEPPPALLEDADDRVSLFHGHGPEATGALSGPGGLRRLLLRLEAQRRSGTLVLASAGCSAHLVLWLGRIMRVRRGDARDVPALLEALEQEWDTYLLTSDFEICERPPLIIWASDLFRRIDAGAATGRLSDPHQARPLDPKSVALAAQASPFLARREEGAKRAFVTNEQRSQGRRGQADDATDF